MRELTTHQIDAELAEQLPARELMNMTYSRHSSGVHQVNSASQGDTTQLGLVNVNATNDQVNLLAFGNSNGGIEQINANGGH